MESTHENILRIENLSYQYGKLAVWSEVNFELKAGEITFLVGQNGTGKSTLLRCLAGTAHPKTGTIFLMEKRFSGKAREQRSEIAFVPDVPVFYDDMTAEEHIRFVLRANRRDDEYLHVEQLLDSFGLMRYLEQYPSSYSRGMREKLALALAFAVKPRLFLFDEPYGPLDHKSSIVLSSEIEACAARGSSVLLSCHHAVPNVRPNKVLLFDDGGLSIKDPSILDTLWGTSPHIYQAACVNVEKAQ